MYLMNRDESCRMLGIYPIDAEDPPTLMTSDRMHRHWHMSLHGDSSRCSIPGLYPPDRRPGDYRVMSRNECAYENGSVFDDS